MKRLVLMLVCLALFSCDGLRPKQKDKVIYETIAPDESANAGENTETVMIDPTAMSLRFLAPVESLTSFGALEIAVQISGVTPSAHWSLFYTEDADGVGSGVPIAEDIAQTTTEVTWETAFSDPGRYFLYATLTDGGSVTVHRHTASITIEGDPIDGNRSPFVNVASPNGNNDFSNGSMISINFSGIDPDENPLLYKIEYSSDAGNNWQLIAEDLNEDNTVFDWTIPVDAPQTARYQIRVTADDGLGRQGSGLNPNGFGVTPTAVTYDADILPNVITNKCLPCHDSANAPTNGNFQADVYQRALDTDPNGFNQRRNVVLRRTRADADNPMPPDGNLTDLERDLIQLWVWNGGAEN